ncbi:WAT1-related protein At1g44800-like [Phalaenopsis equestris]|uniref:WAT1-related protein At1g44800-like n=1 Tax=Phalaenopsis equestris TaxID=78828 RepID=UPI0009E2DF86|nr:WAT1-related protein At1g44800-like [Phalaenopsis equestris]
MVAMGLNGSCKKALQRVKPYGAMMLVQFSFAVMYVILMVTFKKGMNQSVMFVYRSVVAAAVIAPFALCFERNGESKMTLVIFVKVMALGILQPVLDQNFYFLGAKATSTSFASALENINPAITFIMCLLLRFEKLNIRRRHGLAKLIGALLTVIGAILMILYKGPLVEFFWLKGREKNSTSGHANGEAASNVGWIKGTLMVLVSCFSWCSFLILQTNTLKSYPAKLSLTVMVCSIGAVTNAVIALVVEQGSFRPWVLGWDMRLFAVTYSGVVCTAFLYFVLGMVMKEKGPVFASAFNPLTMIITNVLSSIFLAERTALGTVIGAIVLVVGMYLILWGKSNDVLTKLENKEGIEGIELHMVAPNIIDGGSPLRAESMVIEIQKTENEIPA